MVASQGGRRSASAAISSCRSVFSLPAAAISASSSACSAASLSKSASGSAYSAYTWSSRAFASSTPPMPCSTASRTLWFGSSCGSCGR